ncbi:hypothetical protein MLAC_25880 [Mycobacterium lacus]|uniref:Uncharacterized protein n=1 Tax=Mycobacterium lacus TaxID=169765 RepID=A0A7I7NL13_9MYCO|nr:hypothetical protein MLAC_25880 [Mycobacterium lacus]
MIALLDGDGMIHQQDIRRPLGLPRDIPPQRLRTALDYALTSPAVRGARRPAAHDWSQPTSTGRTAAVLRSPVPRKRS